jgi:hypothetical protein
MPLINARDVRTYIQELGFEKGVVQSLERLLDELVEWRQNMRQLTDLTSRCIDEVEKLIAVGDSMKRTIEQIRRDRQQHEDSDGDLQG